MAKVDPLDAALAAEAKKRNKRKPVAPKRLGNKPVNLAEPAHSVIVRLGGVRQIARTLEISPGAVSRWQTPKTAANPQGGGGVIPEERRGALIEMAKQKRMRLSKGDFLK